MKIQNSTTDLSAVSRQKNDSQVNKKDREARAPEKDQDLLIMPAKERAQRTAQSYVDTASGDLSTPEKLAIFEKCFHEKAEFRGPIFGHLSGRQIYGKLTIEHDGGADIRYEKIRPKDLRRMAEKEIAKIDPRAAKEGEAWYEVTLRWQADYKLGGNPIHNEVTTTLVIDGQGKIRRQTDDFDKDRWMDQAMPGIPAGIRRSAPFRWAVNFGLGILTFLK